MTETAAEMARRLIDEIKAGGKAKFERHEVNKILNQIAMRPDTDGANGCRAPATVKELRRGDVFIGAMVGGKVRPWITLRVTDHAVTAVSMSSGDSAPNMIQSKCRYWPSNWIGSTVSQFAPDAAKREVMRPYTNAAHLNEVENILAAKLGFEIPKKKISSISEIVEGRKK